VPVRDQHLQKADRGAAVEAALIDGALSIEWATTVLFYRAVHVIEAWFALRGVHHQSHTVRTRAVYRELPEVAADYVDLLEASRTARYEPDGLLDTTEYDRLSAAFVRVDARVRSEVR